MKILYHNDQNDHGFYQYYHSIVMEMLKKYWNNFSKFYIETNKQQNNQQKGTVLSTFCLHKHYNNNIIDDGQILN